jgi:nucleoside-diphosphate-sugar epimerase
VTGARGFIGRHVVQALATSGHDIHAVTSGNAAVPNTCTWHRADLLDAAQRRALVTAARADALLHLAWHAKPPDYWHDRSNLHWLAASLELVREFHEQGGTRVVAVGTCAEYDWSHGRCIERVTPLAARSLYGVTKAACGTVLEAYGDAAGLSVAWARLFFLLGPHDSPVRLVPSIIERLRAGQPAHCRAGALLRDFLYVGDAAAALAALVDSPVTGPVNIGSGTATRVGDLATAVARRLGRGDLLQVDDNAPEDAIVVADIGRLRDEVGWLPSVSLDDAVDRTIRGSSPGGKAAS